MMDTYLIFINTFVAAINFCYVFNTSIPKSRRIIEFLEYPIAKLAILMLAYVIANEFSVLLAVQVVLAMLFIEYDVRA